MADPLAWIDDEVDRLKESHLYREFVTRESPPVAGMVQLDGNQFINFGSNDYLGIAASEELVLAVQNSVSQVGVGSGASPLINGRGTLHRRLEHELAAFEGTESTLLFPTGYAANVGAICSLVGAGDVVFSDSLNHASIVDGCRLSGAKIVVYPHSNVSKLNELINSATGFKRRLIVSDGLFSMDGDFADVPSLCEIADQHDAMLMIDEAHATGTVGENGKGCCEYFGVDGRVDIVVGTLSKALGCQGGFVAGRENLIRYLFNKARTQIFSTAQPEAISAAALAALEIVRNQPQRREKLKEKSAVVRDQLAAAGLDIGTTQSHIIPVILGSNQIVLEQAKQLKKSGIFVPAIRPPSVAENASRLRVCLTSTHNAEQLDKLMKCLIR